jgi:ABC-type cobalamin/Fe3+-siderophores transport system ATPase subunit
MRPAAIDVSGLAVSGTDRCRLEVDQLRAEAGEVTALMGPNGAGKTTLLRASLGLVPVASGCVRTLGEEVTTLRGAGLAALRRRVGYVPQLLPGGGELPLTVREVVAIGRTARAGLFTPLTRNDWEVVDHWIARVGLETRADRPFSRLSGGEQRKTVIARAMAQEPELLLLDEPTANLDLGWRERLVATIDALHLETRIGVVLVCHELEVLPPSCRQVILLEAGRVAASGAPEALFTTERVSRLYGAPLQALHRAGRHAVLPGAGLP